MSRRHWKQRSAKSSSISERHFRRRLTERYGISVTTEEYHQLSRDIQNGMGRLLFRESLTRTHWLVRVKGVAVRTVYDKTVKALATALPMDAADAIAMEAATAGETEGLDTKCDSAGPKDIAQPQPPSRTNP